MHREKGSPNLQDNPLAAVPPSPLTKGEFDSVRSSQLTPLQAERSH